MSALAWKSLVPAREDQASVWSIGAVGALLSLFSGWLERYADFMLLLGGLLVPVGGVLLARFFLLRRTVTSRPSMLEDGAAKKHGGFAIPGMCGWVAGAASYFLAGRDRRDAARAPRRARRHVGLDRLSGPREAA